MKTTDQNFMTQRWIREQEIQLRKDMVDFMQHGAELLKECGNFIRAEINDVVAQIYARLVGNDDMNRIIGNHVKEKANRYARILEEKVARQTQGINNIMRRDALTDVHNRRSSKEQIRKYLAKAQRQNLPLSLVYLDVDYFKNINGSEGYQQGNEVLTSVGRILNTIYQESAVSEVSIIYIR
jgi:PleD family two-component response regulator